MVLWRQLSNPTSPLLSRAIRAYRQLDLAQAPQTPAPRRQVKRAVRLSAVQVGRLIEHYQCGATVYELAAEFGIQRATVACRLKDAGVILRRQGPVATDIDEMIRLYTSGLSLAAVGQRLGFDAETIRTHIKARGVQTRDPHGRKRGGARVPC